MGFCPLLRRTAMKWEYNYFGNSWEAFNALPSEREAKKQWLNILGEERWELCQPLEEHRDDPRWLHVLGLFKRPKQEQQALDENYKKHVDALRRISGDESKSVQEKAEMTATIAQARPEE